MQRCRFNFSDNNSVEISWNNNESISDCYIKAYTKYHGHPPSKETIAQHAFFIIVPEDFDRSKTVFQLIDEGVAELAAFEKENLPQ